MKSLPRVAALALLVSSGCALAAYGCASTTDLIAYAPYTEIYVDPTSFLYGTTDAGDPPPLCGAGSASLLTYVATLHDVTYDPDAGANFPGAAVYDLPSSQPTRCSLDAAFGQVIYGHLYTGDIEGYTQDLCSDGGTSQCITPLGGLTSGARTMLDADGNVVAPTWRTSCGNSLDREADGGDAVATTPSGPTIAGYELEVRLRACGALERIVPLVSEDGGAPNDGATLVVASTPLIAPVGCDLDGGSGGATRLQGTVRQTGETHTVTVASAGGSCTAPDLTFSNVVENESYDVDVVAFLDDGQPSLGTTCTGTTRPSAAVSAPCSPLSTEAAIAIDTNAVASAAGLSCGNVGAISVTLLGLGSRTVSGACGSDLLFANLAPGLYQLTAQLFTGSDTSGTPEATVTCNASVTAGAYVTATCG